MGRRDCGGSCPPCGNCPWLDVTDHPDMLGCADGTQCNRTDLGWGCCVGDHGGRAVCPPTHPFMCDQNNLCGGGQDRCCAPSAGGCDGAGGVRPCHKPHFEGQAGPCRLNEADTTHDGQGHAVAAALHLPSLQDCFDACTDHLDCAGVEYGSSLSISRCELWLTPIGAIGSSPGNFSC